MASSPTPPMRPTPLVSIGLPVYNGEAFLAQTLDDFLAQTFGDFELLVCDNASTDRTADIAREYAARDPRIRYLRSERNIGLMPNFNRAFHESAPARYFAWSAHDDRRSPQFLERLVGRLEAAPEAVLAYNRAAIIGPHGHPMPYDSSIGAFIAPDDRIYHDDRGLEQDIVGPPEDRFRRVLLSTMVNTPIHGVFRRSFLETSSLFQFYGADTLLLAEAALAGTFCYVDEDLFLWRLHPSGTAYMTREQWAEWETGIEGFRPTLPIRSFPRYMRAVGRARLGLAGSMRAYAAVLRYLVRLDKLHRIFVPSPVNYFGIRRWPWQADAQWKTLSQRRVEGPASSSSEPLAASPASKVG